VIKRYDIVWVNLDPTIGKEIKKTRPCIIISPDELNEKLDTVIVAPITSTIKKWPFRLTITINNKQSSIAFDQIRTVSKLRVAKKIGSIRTAERQAVLNILLDMFAD
jgi:mRNA interferase MazF